MILQQSQPQMDGQGLLAPPWGDCIREAVQFENSYNWESDPRFAGDGVVGGVIGFLEQMGRGDLMQAAGQTEEAARNNPGGGVPMGVPMGQPVPQQFGMPQMGGQMMQGGMGLPQHLQCLANVQKIEVKEKVNFLEALTAIIGQEIEMANKYKIFNDGGEEELFYAAEQTDCCTRQAKQCCPDCAPWKLHILYTQNGQQQLVYQLERGWTCTCLCFNRPVVEVTDVVQGKKIGSMKDPFACCNLTFSMRDAEDNDVLYANGGCCQWGLCCPLPCGPCAEVNFPVTDFKSGDDVAHVQKKVPGCCKFFLAPDVDNYKVDFQKVQDPNWKALLMAFTIFLDFRFFNDNSNDDNGGLMGAMGDGGE